MTIRKFWSGNAPNECELCGEPIRNTFAHAKTVMEPWGNMDLKCLRVYGVGLGAGKGQLYQRQEDGRWLKVEG